MNKKFVFALISAVLLAINVQAQEAKDDTTEEIVFSSDGKIQQEKLKLKNKTMTDINRMVYDEDNEKRMRELVRNNNAIKKIMGEKEVEVDVKDKSALSKYMETELGLDKVLETEGQDSATQPETETKYRSKAAELLK